MKLRFFVPGEPCAQGRPRVTIRGGFAHAYDPAKSKNYKAFVKLVATDAAKKQDWKYTELALELTIRAYFPINKSATKKFREAALLGLAHHVKKPDCSNLVKGIEDAMNKIIYKDDSQIVRLVVEKYYAGDPGVEVTLEVVE